MIPTKMADSLCYNQVKIEIVALQNRREYLNRPLGRNYQ